MKVKSWVVRLKCEVIKEVIADGCTREEAEANPFAFAVNEREIHQRDWEVVSIQPNE